MMCDIFYKKHPIWTIRMCRYWAILSMRVVGCDILRGHKNNFETLGLFAGVEQF